MSTSTQTLTTDPTTTVSPVRAPLWRRTVVASVAAAVVNLCIVAIADAAGVSLTVDDSGEAIPLLGFVQMTVLGGLVGLAIAVWSRRSAAPRRRFLTVAVALTVVTLVPPLVVQADTSTRLVLELTHLVAAAIIIPTIARRLPR